MWGEFDKETLLAFEKETLGIYVSGHPMEAYQELWQKNVTARTSDFIVDEDGHTVVEDNSIVVVGGMITAKKVKTTRTSQLMAFVSLEDMVGTVEALVFPKIYEKNKQYLTEDSKVFLRGRASIGDDPVGKLVCEEVIPFSAIPNELWLQFEDQEFYERTVDSVMGGPSGIRGEGPGGHVSEEGEKAQTAVPQLGHRRPGKAFGGTVHFTW